MITALFWSALIFWMFAGIFLWTGLHGDVKRWYKKLLLMVMSGPIVWLFSILLLAIKSFDCLDGVYMKFEKWMKE